MNHCLYSYKRIVMYYSVLLVNLVAYKNLRQIIEQFGMPTWGALKADAPDNLFSLVIMLHYILFLFSITDRTLQRY